MSKRTWEFLEHETPEQRMGKIIATICIVGLLLFAALVAK